MNPLDPVLVAVLVSCFAGAAALAVAEVAILRVRRSEILLEADRSGRAARLLRLLDDLPVVLNCVLLAVLLIQVSAATIAGYLAARWFGGAAVTITTFLLTMVLFVYGEAVPKTVAVRRPRAMALRMTPLLRVLVRVLRPAVTVLMRLADLQTPGEEVATRALTESEIRALAREAAQVGEIADRDVTLVDRAFEFNDRSVGEIMVERDRIHAVALTAPLADALRDAITHGHRRLPVHGDDLDEIHGVVRLRDLASIAQTSPEASVEQAMTDVLRCRPELPISDLLSRMQVAGQWLAIVTSPDGATVGLVTIEDVVAELVGEIADEATSLGVDRDEPGERPDRRTGR